jgi:hypothetical protein
MAGWIGSSATLWLVAAVIGLNTVALLCVPGIGRVGRATA